MLRPKSLMAASCPRPRSRSWSRPPPGAAMARRPISAPRAVTGNRRRRLVRVACGGPSRGRGAAEEWKGREGEEGEEDGGDDCVGARAERRPAALGLWSLERGCVVPGRGEFGGLFAPFSDGCSRRREGGRPGQPVRMCWRVGWRARGVSCTPALCCLSGVGRPSAREEQIMSNGAPGLAQEFHMNKFYIAFQTDP